MRTKLLGPAAGGGHDAHRMNLRRPSFVSCLTAATVFAVLVAAYAPAFAFPFALDDWGKLLWLDQHPSWMDRIQGCFWPQDRLFYRPLSHLSAALLQAAWPHQPVAYHVLNLLLLGLTALTAGALVRDFTGQARVGRLVAVLFAAATPIHLETQFWMVGLNDLAMLPLIFTALLLHLRGRAGAAAAAWALALLFKESAAFVPVVAAAATLLQLDAPAATPRRRWLRLWPYVLVGLIYVAIKMAGTPPTAVATDHPYAVQLARTTIGPRIADYARWLFHGLAPALAGGERWDQFLRAAGAKPLPLHALVWSSVALTLFVAARENRTQLRRVALAWCWILLSLGPLLLMPNHASRYYLLTALPAALWLALLVLEATLRAVRARPQPARIALALVIAGSAVGGVGYARARTAEGLDQRFSDGTNLPIRRSTATRIVMAQLPALFPDLPRAAMVLFENLDVYGFGPAPGLRVWYGDPTIISYPAEPMRQYAVLMQQAELARVERRLRVVRWDGAKLVDVTASWPPYPTAEDARPKAD